MIAKEAIKTLKANYPDACYGQLRGAVDAAIEALKAQDAAGDTIYRQDAIRTLEDSRYSTDYCKEHGIDHSINMEMVRILLNDLPSAQQEEAIPITWLEKHIEWLQSLNNDFATLTAGIIIGTIAKWRGDQDD